MALLALIALVSPAWADDFDFDALLNDIDLGGAAAETHVYSGSSVAVSGALALTGKATIRHGSGNLTVRCGEVEQVKAVLSYTLEGTDQAVIKRYGDALVVTATGQGAAVSVNTSKPARPALSRHSADLVVTVPRGAAVDAEAAGGVLTVDACTGAVRAVGAQGVSVSGAMKGFDVASASGDIAVVLEEGGTLGAKSAINATKGNVSLQLGYSENAKLDARGASVSVAQAVAGTLDANVALGVLGNGGPPITVRAGGAVAITAR